MRDEHQSDHGDTKKPLSREDKQMLTIMVIAGLVVIGGFLLALVQQGFL